ncbi:MAG: sugar ABC transporter substrate-binding protein [Anaerolineaceae bacterium]|nr:MAG: sugar ABC transporter substrate-binding protein [Anaerolineaceae bacterium]
MKKRFLALVLTSIMVLTSLVACGKKETRTSKTDSTKLEGQITEKDKGKTEVDEAAGEIVDIKGMTVGYCMPDTSESFLANLSNSVKEKFEADGVTVEIANAAGDSITQISQVENFATAGTELIILMSVDPTGVKDVVLRAQEAGSKVLVAGSDTGAYDALMFIEQYEDGVLIAELGAEWIEANYPNAEPGSIEIALLEDRSTPEASQRCDGMNTITELTDKVTIVETVGSVKNNDTAQAAMGNIMQTSPDIKMVLCYNSSAAMGVNEFAMRDGSPIEDPSKFAVFCSDLDPAAIQMIIDSKENKAVLRGLVKFGSDDLARDTYELAKKMLSGAKYEKLNPDPLTKITIENAADFQ